MGVRVPPFAPSGLRSFAALRISAGGSRFAHAAQTASSSSPPFRTIRAEVLRCAQDFGSRFPARHLATPRSHLLRYPIGYSTQSVRQLRPQKTEGVMGLSSAHMFHCVNSLWRIVRKVFGSVAIWPAACSAFGLATEPPGSFRRLPQRR
jgi:hypothetical protein